ncbi:hypothetical protein [Phenylobacterium sp.]|uniref:hypothetical protein n=1 Tax=Phenylobacterium sp. TaxID=1871053 RepID=UPI002730A327|nr:hypothetical protein [Phenylobacterium sp.]MDP1619179.1 hypothetical protein [Phenylobacterium sp.]MDP1986424.1 hypothetical protein [Phenylobacterium sp.]
MNDRTVGRKIAIIAAVTFAIMVPALQALTGWGQSAAEFSSDGNQTLRAAGYAFSIWGVIYAGLALYAVFQALPGRAEPHLMAAVAWPSAVASLGCGLWIIASAADLDWATVVVILISAGAVIWGLIVARSRDLGLVGLSRYLVVWPLGLLAGWLTVASAVNILTVFTAKGIIGPTTALASALVGVGVTTLIAAVVAERIKVPTYGLAVAWGLAAVGVAEWAPKPMVGGAGYLGAGVILILTLWLAFRRKPFSAYGVADR